MLSTDNTTTVKSSLIDSRILELKPIRSNLIFELSLIAILNNPSWFVIYQLSESSLSFAGNSVTVTYGTGSPLESITTPSTMV